MNLLAIDTSTDRSLIAVAGRTGFIAHATTDAGRQHGRELIPRLKTLLASAGIAVGEIESIAVGLGPGSYTGSRVGVTAAKTLAYATGARLIGINSLHAIAGNAPASATRVSVVADAQRGEIYVADFTRPAPGGPLTSAAETCIEPIAAWVGRMKPGTVVLGPALGVPRVRAALPAHLLSADEDLNGPRPEPFIELARESLGAGRSDDAWRLEPLYLRRSAAEDQWDARIAATSG
jgi:tRNA threonylcarbamoyladenosine biosynthesis protein TsaB